MRIISLVLIASLAFAPGCATIAIAAATPPAIGIAGGSVIGVARNHAGAHVSVAHHAWVGAIIGAAVDVVLVALAIRSFAIDLGHLGPDHSCPGCN
jgi:hypothetical protein